MFEPRLSDWPPACSGREAAPGLLPFGREPVGDAYRGICEFAAAHCQAFALVWRDQLDFEPAALDVARRLEPWLCFESHTHEWPGTRLLGGKAWVRGYRVAAASLSEVSKVGGLYRWLSPSLPEDLSFYRLDGRGWVGSISHEGEGWLDLETFGEDVSRDLLRVLADHRVIAPR